MAKDFLCPLPVVYGLLQRLVLLPRQRAGDGLGLALAGPLVTGAAGSRSSTTMTGETWIVTKYQGRVVAGANSGWFNLNAAGAPSRSTGWHKFVIERRADGTTVDFYVDNILSRTITGATLSSLDSAAIGSVGSGTATAGEAWIDDVKVEYFDLPVITTPPATVTVAAGALRTFQSQPPTPSAATSGARTGPTLPARRPRRSRSATSRAATPPVTMSSSATGPAR